MTDLYGKEIQRRLAEWTTTVDILEAVVSQEPILQGFNDVHLWHP